MFVAVLKLHILPDLTRFRAVLAAKQLHQTVKMNGLIEHKLNTLKILSARVGAVQLLLVEG